MTRAFIMTMKRPEQSLGLPVPLARRLPELGRLSWMAALVVLTVAAVGLYIYQVNHTATKSFAMRQLEKQSETLKNSVASLETQAVQLQAMQNLQERVKPFGYVAVDRMDFLDVAKGSYALAK
ncbi:MAG: hypothetical protein Q7R83_03710 [bacterium]|nr:hypothetical protein [bacterium]